MPKSKKNVKSFRIAPIASRTGSYSKATEKPPSKRDLFDYPKFQRVKNLRIALDASRAESYSNPAKIHKKELT